MRRVYKEEKEIRKKNKRIAIREQRTHVTNGMESIERKIITYRMSGLMSF